MPRLGLPPRGDGRPSCHPAARRIVVGAEQSNTSLTFGDEAILKVFRKVSPGVNPDIEMHSALQRRAARTSRRRSAGSRAAGPTTPATVTAGLAMSQVFLKGATDGWELALTSVRDLYGRPDLHADEVGGDFAGEAHRLGAATAEVHATLAEALPTGRSGGQGAGSAGRGHADPPGPHRGRRTRAGALRRPPPRRLRRTRDCRRRGVRPAGARRLPPGPGDAHTGGLEAA